VNWLLASVVLSIGLTLVVNLLLRLWPGADRRAERLGDWAERQRSGSAADGAPRVQVVAPWKAMLIGSIVLTVLLNVVLRLF
jgi:hypothetical protein